MVSKNLDNINQTDDQSHMIEDSTAEKTTTLAHLSDPHISCMQDITARDLMSKRLFGYLRWKLHRGAEHRNILLSAIQSDLVHTKPDHIVVTGDLTHLSLSTEYKKARRWLRSLGTSSQVTVIPGNHDAYVKLHWQQTMAYWTEYMLSDTHHADAQITRNTDAIFPSLRTRGCIAVIGVCTAHPSAPHLAVGSIGGEQLQNLETILAQTARRQLYRILLIHHPPVPGTVSWRKRLTDAADLHSLLENYGVELILHGHAHRTLHNYLRTTTGKIPVVGVPSISALGRTPERRARYYIYRSTPGTKGWDVKLEVRIFSPEKNGFTRESEQLFN